VKSESPSNQRIETGETHHSMFCSQYGTISRYRSQSRFAEKFGNDDLTSGLASVDFIFMQNTPTGLGHIVLSKSSSLNARGFRTAKPSGVVKSVEGATFCFLDQRATSSSSIRRSLSKRSDLTNHLRSGFRSASRLPSATFAPASPDTIATNQCRCSSVTDSRTHC